MHDLISLSAKAMAREIRSKRSSAVEVVGAHIQRIRGTNPELNAVVAPRFSAAMEEAEAADRRIREGDRNLPPLLGVPFTVKEFVGVEGMPQTGGILARSAAVAEQDATVVRRLRRAGAIVVGVTNAPEGGLWHETSNPVYGRTRNPHDLFRTCGGSSGGEAAIVAAGGAPFGIGSDSGGSLRIPAAFCGIASHKPTGGLVPNTGHFPPAPSTATRLMSIGPMARHVEDLELVMQLIAGPDDLDHRCVRDLEESDPIDLTGVTVHPLPSNGRTRPSAEVEASVHKAARALQLRGARVAPWPGPSLARAFELWAAILASSNERYEQVVGAAANPWRQALRWTLGRADHSGAVIAMMLLERGIERLPAFTERLLAEADALSRELDETLGRRSVLLHPVYPRTAPRHRAIALRSPFDTGCTTVFNISEGPVTVVRTDTGPRGLPIGLQIAAARGGDWLTLGVGKALEATFGAPLPVTPRWGRPAPFGAKLA